jgi:hypothetical protein
MMNRCYLFLLLAWANIGAAQTFQWADVKPINISTNPDPLLHLLTLDTAGNPVYARLNRSTLMYGADYFGDQIIEKLNRAGHSLSADTLFGTVTIKTIAVDRSNNLIVAGLFRDTMRVGTAILTLPHNGFSSCFMLKLSPVGELLWLKDMTQLHPDWLGISSMKVDNAGSLRVAVGTTTQSTFVKKLDGNGNEIGSLEQSNVQIISSLAFDTNGNLWVSGSVFDGALSFNGLLANPPFFYNMYVVRYTPGGVASWVRFVEDVTLQSPEIATYGNTAVLSGRLFNSASFGGLVANGPQWVFDLFITRIDSSGQFVWLREIPPGNSQGDATIGTSSFLTVASDGGILVSGFTRNRIDWGGGVVTQARNYQSALVLKYSLDGEIQWAKTAGSATWSNRAEAITTDLYGTAYLTGMVGQSATFDSLQFAGGNVNSFVASISPAGVTSVGNEGVAGAFSLFQNYPNPFNPRTVIQFGVEGRELVKLGVFDVLGREVATLVNEVKAPGTYTAPWDASGLASGVYFYRLQARGFTQTRRLMLLR